MRYCLRLWTGVLGRKARPPRGRATQTSTLARRKHSPPQAGQEVVTVHQVWVTQKGPIAREARILSLRSARM